MRAYLGLGSNLGDRAGALRQAIEALDWGDTRVVARSSVYETEPVGGPADQPMFLNQVIEIETSLGARELLARCLKAEIALGRSRANEERWGPRTIDIDILVMESLQVDEPDLQVPHPRLSERAFVLVPLAEIGPAVVVPGLGSVASLLLAVDAGGVQQA